MMPTVSSIRDGFPLIGLTRCQFLAAFAFVAAMALGVV